MMLEAGSGSSASPTINLTQQGSPERTTSAGSGGSTRSTIAALDGVRAIAVLSVVGYHLWSASDLGKTLGPDLLPPVAFGFSGVLLFFVLSGFLLFLPYARSLCNGGAWPSTRDFYRRRALRILPVYFVCIGAMILLLGTLGYLTPGILGSLGLVALLMHNFSTGASGLVAVVNGPLWTLALEWQFYLLLPWFALALKHTCQGSSKSKFVRILASLVAVVAFGLATRVLAAIAYFRVGAAVPMDAPGMLGLTLRMLYGYCGRFLEVFALGMLLSVLYVWFVESGHFPRRWSGPLAASSFILAAAGLFICMRWSETTHVLVAPDIWAFYTAQGTLWIVLGVWVTGLSFAFLMLGVLFGPPIVGTLFALPPLRFIGLISYSIYAWHVPIFHLVGHAIPALVITLLVSVASYYIIERPFLMRRYAGSRRKAAMLAPTSTSMPITEALASEAIATEHSL